MKQAERTGVEPLSLPALTSAPASASARSTSRRPATAAHQSGVTVCTERSSGTSYTPRCSSSASHTCMRYSTISTLPRLHATNSGAHPSRRREHTARLSGGLILSSAVRRRAERRAPGALCLHSCINA